MDPLGRPHSELAQFCFPEKLVRYDPAVVEADQAIRAPGEFVIVCHEKQRSPLAAVEIEQHFEDMTAIGAVEVAGGLVRQDEGRSANESPCDRHPLLLAAGKLDRVVVEAIRKADTFQKFSSARRTLMAVDPKVERKQDVFLSGQGGDQLVGLKHESDLAPAQHRHLVFAQVRDFLAVEQDLA